MARLTGLEPATPGVTGRYSNRLSYNRASDPVLRPNVSGVLCATYGAVKRSKTGFSGFFPWRGLSPRLGRYLVENPKYLWHAAR